MCDRSIIVTMEIALQYCLHWVLSKVCLDTKNAFNTVKDVLKKIVVLSKCAFLFDAFTSILTFRVIWLARI